MFAGAYAGALARLIAAPFDLLKIRFQLQQSIPSQGGAVKYKNMWQACKTIMKEEGIGALWKGNIAATYLWISYSMVQFGVYGLLKDTGESLEAKFAAQLSNDRSDPFWNRAMRGQDSGSKGAPNNVLQSNRYLHTLLLFLCGAGAAVVATGATYPLDIMRTQFTIQGKEKIYPTMASFISNTFQKQGIKGFYTGISPTLVGITPYIGLNFSFYDITKRWMDTNAKAKTEEGQVMGALRTGFAGAVAGGASKFLVYPLDTVKRRMQASALRSSIEGGNVLAIKYRGMVDCITRTVADEGAAGLYKGIAPTLLKSCISTAVTFAAYEQGLLLAKSLRVEADNES